MSPIYGQKSQRQAFDIQYKRAQSYERFGQNDEALALYLSILEKNPDERRAYYRAMQLYEANENWDGQLILLGERLKLSPQDIELRADEARIRYGMGEKELAKEIWETIVENAGRSENVFRLVSNAQIRTQALDLAKATLLAGRQKLGRNSLFANDLARLYKVRGEIDLATQELLLYFDANTHAKNYIERELVGFLDNPDNLPIVIEALKIWGKQTDNILASIDFSVTILLHEKKYDDAVHEISAQTPSILAPQTLLNYAMSFEAEKAWSAAQKVYEKLILETKNEKYAGAAILGLGRAIEHQVLENNEEQSMAGFYEGNTFFAIPFVFSGSNQEKLNEAISLYKDLDRGQKSGLRAEAVFRLSDLQLRVLSDTDSAIKGFETVMMTPSNRNLQQEAGFRLIECHLVKGDTVAAKNIWNQVITLTGADEDDSQFIAENLRISLHSKNWTYLKKALLNLSGSTRPADPLFNDGLELSSFIEGNGTLEDENLKRYLEAEVLIGRHKLSEASKLLKLIQRGDVADDAAIRRIELLMLLKQFKAAEDELNIFLEKYETSDWFDVALIWNAELQEKRGVENVTLIPHYERVLVERPYSLYASQCLTKIRQLRGDFN